jgi:hypothetical protein
MQRQAHGTERDPLIVPDTLTQDNIDQKMVEEPRMSLLVLLEDSKRALSAADESKFEYPKSNLRPPGDLVPPSRQPG